MQVPVIVCHPRSGVDEVAVEFSIKWDQPLLRDPVSVEIRIPGDTDPITVPVAQRVERVAEKVPAFLKRAEDRDAFDLYHFAGPDPEEGLTDGEWTELGGRIADKVDLDADIAPGTDLLAMFEEQLATVSKGCGERVVG